MKKLLLTLLCVLFYTGAIAQSDTADEKPVKQSRKALIEEYLQLEEGVAGRFWKVYDEYYDKRKKSRAERVEGFETFIEADSIPEKELRKLVKVDSYIQQTDAMLLAQYYEIFRKRISSEVAGKFYYFEEAMNTISMGEYYKDWHVVRQEEE